MSAAGPHNETRVFPIFSPGRNVRADIVPALGGVVASLQLPGPDGRPRECLYRHAWFWDPGTDATRGGSPVLFPVCGRLLKDGQPGRYETGGRPYVLPLHGFAMRLPWEVRDASRPDALELRLADTAETRAMYPFSFELTLRHAVSDQGYACRLTVANTGDRPMPYYAGFHPYFLTPPPGAGKEQTLFGAQPVTRWLYNPGKTEITGPAPVPAFPMPVTPGDVNELLLELGERRETHLVFPDGFELRQDASDLLRYRQFYTLPGEPFFCDEAWMAPPGSLNRPGAARELPPGQIDTLEIHISSGPA